MTRQKTRMTRSPAILAALALGAALALSGCGTGDPDLRNVRSTGEGPEEFGIVPNKPLELPPSFAELPQPEPNGENRTAQRPLEDAIAALGGVPGRARPLGAVPAADQALVQGASRFGRSADIRSVLAAEDLAFREQKSIFSWQLVREDQYNRAYSDQRLDPFAELERFRRAGVRTPAAPPRELAR